MSDPTTLARTARESLAKGLNALQSDPAIPPQLVELGAPIAQAMGALHQIERSQGAQVQPHADAASGHVRAALSQLQAQQNPPPAVLNAMEAVAASLGALHQLAKLASGPSAAPPAPAVGTAPPAAGPPAGTAPPAAGPAFPPRASPPGPAPVHTAPIAQAAPQGALQAGSTQNMQHASNAAAHAATQAAHGPAPQQPAPQQMAPMGPPPQQPPPQMAPPQQMAPQQPPLQPPQQQLAPMGPPPQQPPPQQPAPQQMAPMGPPPQQQRPGAPGGAVDPFAPPQVAPGPRPTNSVPVPSPPAIGNAQPVDAALGAHSATNFYKGLSGNDIIDHGGLFVATYMIPKLGAPVRLRVSLPGGYEFEANAVVKWLREAADPFGDAQPGFGAQFTQISPEARQLVYRYVRNREPLFHDDL